MLDFAFFAQCLLNLSLIYVLLGIGFSVYFLRSKVSDIDPSAKGIAWHTKALWLPGIIALWPTLVFKKKVK